MTLKFTLFLFAESLRPAVYDLLVDELGADHTLLNIRGETVRPGLTGLWLCEQRSKFSRPDGRLVNVVYLCQFRV